MFLAISSNSGFSPASYSFLHAAQPSSATSEPRSRAVRSRPGPRRRRPSRRHRRRVAAARAARAAAGLPAGRRRNRRACPRRRRRPRRPNRLRSPPLSDSSRPPGACADRGPESVGPGVIVLTGSLPPSPLPSSLCRRRRSSRPRRRAAPSSATTASSNCPPSPVDGGGERSDRIAQRSHARNLTRQRVPHIPRPLHDAATFVMNAWDRHADLTKTPRTYGRWADVTAPHVPQPARRDEAAPRPYDLARAAPDFASGAPNWTLCVGHGDALRHPSPQELNPPASACGRVSRALASVSGSSCHDCDHRNAHPRARARVGGDRRLRRADRPALHSPVIDWFDQHARDLPWRRPEAGAWGVMVSEFMLQQTPGEPGAAGVRAVAHPLAAPRRPRRRAAR